MSDCDICKKQRARKVKVNYEVNRNWCPDCVEEFEDFLKYVKQKGIYKEGAEK